MGSRPSKKHKRKEASVDPDAMEVDPTAMEVDPEAMEGVENAVSTGRLRDAMSAMAIGANRYGLRDRSARKTYFQPDSPESPPLANTKKGKKRKSPIEEGESPADRKEGVTETSGKRIKANESDKKDTNGAKAGDCTFEPPAWATCKAEILQTFGKSWYNGPYRTTHAHKAGYGVYGYYMDENTGCRYIDHEILIVGLNGGFEKNAQNKYILKNNQTPKNCDVETWTKNKDLKRPVGIIVGDRCKAMQQILSHRLNIMEYFMVTDVWEEMQNGYHRFTLRLQKLDLKNKSWWAKDGTPNPPTERDFTPLVETTCTAKNCGRKFPQIYKVGWMCLARDCDQFWRIDEVLTDSAEDLEFDEKFLSWRKEFDVQKCLGNAKYPLIPKLDLSKDDSHTRRDGIVCPDCNRCIPRVYMGNWQCDIDWPALGGVEMTREHEEGCKWAHRLPPKVTKLNSKQLREIEAAYKKAKGRHQTTGYAKSQTDLKDVYGNSMGKITHYTSNKSINEKPNGPDDLFELLQATCHTLGLRRLRGVSPVIPGMLSNSFLKNVGIPYDFQIPMGTSSFKDFDEQNPGVMHAFARLDWAFRDASKDDPYPYTKPNELLFLGYQEGQDLKWHNDGHGKLGPQIATFCLGSECKMMFRLKPDLYFGLDEKGNPVQPEDIILEGCMNADVRKELLEKYQSKAITKAEYDKQRKERLKRSPRGKGRALKPDIILRHGDIVVMNGENTQGYYEHCVESIPGIRFAITARHVFPHCRSVKKKLKQDGLNFNVGNYEIKPEELFDGTK